MSLYSKLPENIKENISNKTLFNKLEMLGFKYDSSALKHIPRKYGKGLCIRLHGMGHYQAITLRTKDMFSLIVLGGADDYQRKNNLIKQTDDGKYSLYKILAYSLATEDSQIYITYKDAINNLDPDKYLNLL